MSKLFLLGLDGATWKVIDPLIKAGKMPNFQSLVSNGVRGELESCIPFITTPAWKCLSTGMNPGKLGVFHWLNFNRSSKKIQINMSNSFHGKDFWDYLGDSGYKVAIIDMPQTWPPPKVNGFMVSGMHAMDWSEYTQPPDLKKDLVETYNYKLFPRHYYSDGHRVIPEIKNIIRTRFAVARTFCRQKDIDLLFLTIYFTDTVQHYYWKHMVEGGEFQNAIESVWQLIDDELGRLYDMLGDEWNFILVSDHGMSELNATFYGNSLLIQNGYLKLRPDMGERVGGFLERMIALATKYGFSTELLGWYFFKRGKYFRLLFPEDKIAETYVGRPILTINQEIGIKKIVELVDWKRTKAIIVGEGLVYITTPRDDPSYGVVKQGLINLFRNVVDPRTGKPIMRVLPSDDIYCGAYTNLGPDILLHPTEGYLITDRMMLNGELWNMNNKEWSAFHDEKGIFAARGRAFRQNYDIGNISIYDIMPTILRLYHLHPPSDIDGRVREDFFSRKELS